MSDMTCICACTYTLHKHIGIYIGVMVYQRLLPQFNHTFMVNTSTLCMSNGNSEIIAIIASCKLIARQFSHCISIPGIHIHRLVMPKWR